MLRNDADEYHMKFESQTTDEEGVPSKCLVLGSHLKFLRANLICHLQCNVPYRVHLTNFHINNYV